MWFGLINEIKFWFVRTFKMRNCWMPKGDVSFTSTWSDDDIPQWVKDADKNKEENKTMKKLLLRFGNWIVRKCTGQTIGYKDEIYINGRRYKFSRITTETLRHNYSIINIEVIDGDMNW